MSIAQTGKKHTEESKKKMSEAQKGRFAVERHPMLGKTQSDESRKKMSESRKGKCAGEQHPMWGKSPSDEARKKMSAARIGKPSPRRRQVYCIELDKQWDCISGAEKELGINHVSEAASGKRNYAGLHPDTKEPLHWIYLYVDVFEEKE